MKKILVTGGTVFVSRYIAEYYVAKGEEVYVLNRNTRPQSRGVRLLAADRHALQDSLRGYSFDVVIDTGYTAADVQALLDALDGYGQYVFVSSSAVYPEYEKQPFRETAEPGQNRIWGRYGADKLAAERFLLQRDPQAYILRPPYLYGPMNNVYREAFVFDCALAGRTFYLPRDGGMKLQFFHIHDLCRFLDILLEKAPPDHLFNVGNRETVSVRQWVESCYAAAGKRASFVNVDSDIEQRCYFCFYDYEYRLDVFRQQQWMPDQKNLQEGLRESFAWYIGNQDKVNKKPLLDFIDRNFAAPARAGL